MFPASQDALPLPPRPDPEQYKKRAKELVKASRSTDPQAIRAWSTNWVESMVRLSRLQITPQLPVRIEHWIDELEQFARKKMSSSKPSTLTDAQFAIARAHGFESWPKLAKHMEALTRANSPVSAFEQAAEAIVAGDVSTLQRRLRENPKLSRARSTREHQATLLHYISANGIEGYRQRTPANAVPIAELLLRSGADVNATANVYGGQATTLALVATSLHPEQAGVHEALMQLLIDHGARIDCAKIDDPSAPGSKGLLINACLANGRGQAAEFLARHGARLDLEASSGLGRLDVVQTFFDDKGNLIANATRLQAERALLRASQYGRNRVIEFLLQRGVSLGTHADTGQTALHWAVIGGHLETINLLLNQGASLEIKNAYDGTPLGQALWSAVHDHRRIDYVPVIETLIKNGAQIEEGTLAWLSQQKEASPQLKHRLAQVLTQHGAKS